MKTSTSLTCLAALAALALAVPLAAGPPSKRADARTRLAGESATLAALAAPVTGFAATGSGEALALRPIEGVPGASVFGTPVALPEGVERIRVAPGNAFAVLEMAEHPRIVALLLKPGGGAVCLPLEEAGPPAEVAFSPGGRMAALLSADRAVVRVFDPAAGPAPLVETAFPGSPLADFAVSDLGELLAIDRSGAVWYAAQDGTPVAVAGGMAAAVAFAPQPGRAVVWDAAARSLRLLELAGGAWSSRAVASGPEGVSEGVLLRVLSGGGAALLTARGMERVWRIGIEEPRLEEIELPVEARMLEGLCLRDTFLLHTGEGGLSWLLTAAAEEPQVVFVPAVTGEGERQ